jgi:hypothetical protein
MTTTTTDAAAYTTIITVKLGQIRRRKNHSRRGFSAPALSFEKSHQLCRIIMNE